MWGICAVMATVCATLLSAAPAFAGFAPVTSAATGVTSTSAILHGNWGFSTGSASSYDYGTTIAYGTNVASNNPALGNGIDEPKLITGLTPGTTYHFRFNYGAQRGIDLTFTTSGGGGGGGGGGGSDADVAISGRLSLNNVLVGQFTALTLTVTNTTGVTATGITVSSTLPAGASLESISSSQGSCSGSFSCSLGSLALGSSATITLVLQPTIAGTIVVDSTVSTTTNDPTPSNNVAHNFIQSGPVPVARTLTLSGGAGTRVAGPGGSAAETYVQLQGTLTSSDSNCVGNVAIQIFQSATANDSTPTLMGTISSGNGSFNILVSDNPGQFWKLQTGSTTGTTFACSASNAVTFTLPPRDVTRKLTAKAARVAGTTNQVTVTGNVTSVSLLCSGGVTVNIATSASGAPIATAKSGGAAGDFTTTFTSTAQSLYYSVAANTVGINNCSAATATSAGALVPVRRLPTDYKLARPAVIKAGDNSFTISGSVSSSYDELIPGTKPSETLPCVAGQVVTVEQNDGSGGWKQIASGKADAAGKFSLTVPDDSGDFRVALPAVTVGNFACGAVTNAFTPPVKNIQRALVGTATRLASNPKIVHITGTLSSLGKDVSVVPQCVPNTVYVFNRLVGAGTGVLTGDGQNVSNGDTVTVGRVTYVFRKNFFGNGQPNEVLIGDNLQFSLSALVYAINGNPLASSIYGQGTQPNPDVIATKASRWVINVNARVDGPAARSIATSDSSAHLKFDNATLGAPGADDSWEAVGSPVILDAKGHFAGDISSPGQPDLEWQFRVDADKVDRFNCLGAIGPLSVPDEPATRSLTFIPKVTLGPPTVVPAHFQFDAKLTSSSGSCVQGANITVEGGDSPATLTGSTIDWLRSGYVGAFTGDGIGKSPTSSVTLRTYVPSLAFRASVPAETRKGVVCDGASVDYRDLTAPAIDNVAKSVTLTGNLEAVSKSCRVGVDVSVDYATGSSWNSIATTQTGADGTYSVTFIEKGDYSGGAYRVSVPNTGPDTATCLDATQSFTMPFPKPLPPPPPPPASLVTLALGDVTKDGVYAHTNFVASVSGPASRFADCITDGTKLDVKVFRSSQYIWFTDPATGRISNTGTENTPDWHGTLVFDTKGHASANIPLARTPQLIVFGITGSLGLQSQCKYDKTAFNIEATVPGYGDPAKSPTSFNDVKVTVDGFADDPSHTVTVTGRVTGGGVCGFAPAVSAYRNPTTDVEKLRYKDPLDTVFANTDGSFTLTFPDPGNAYGPDQFRVVTPTYETLQTKCVGSAESFTVKAPPVRPPVTVNVSVKYSLVHYQGNHVGEYYSVLVTADTANPTDSAKCLENLQAVASTGSYANEAYYSQSVSKSAKNSGHYQSYDDAAGTVWFRLDPWSTDPVPLSRWVPQLNSDNSYSMQSTVNPPRQVTEELRVIQGGVDEPTEIVVTPTAKQPSFCAPIAPVWITLKGANSHAYVIASLDRARNDISHHDY